MHPHETRDDTATCPPHGILAEKAMLGKIAPMAQSTFRNVGISRKTASLLSQVCGGLLAQIGILLERAAVHEI